MRRDLEALLWLAVTIGLGCSSSAVEEPRSLPESPFEGRRWVDLTHPYNEETVFWPTGKPFEHRQTAWGETEQGYFYSSYDFAASEHSGTHLDAPIHFAAERATVDELPIERLVGPAFLIDATAAAADAPDYRVTVADIEAAEAEYGAIPADGIVLIRTDWSRRWPDAKAYLGDDRPGRTDDLHFPGLGADAARLLVERQVSVVGIDTASIDYGPSTDFETHRILADREIAILENLTNLAALPSRGAWILAFPMKIGGGSGAPCRVAAIVP